MKTSLKLFSITSYYKAYQYFSEYSFKSNEKKIIDNLIPFIFDFSFFQKGEEILYFLEFGDEKYQSNNEPTFIQFIDCIYFEDDMFNKKELQNRNYFIKLFYLVDNFFSFLIESLKIPKNENCDLVDLNIFYDEQNLVSFSRLDGSYYYFDKGNLSLNMSTYISKVSNIGSTLKVLKNCQIDGVKKLSDETKSLLPPKFENPRISFIVHFIEYFRSGKKILQFNEKFIHCIYLEFNFNEEEFKKILENPDQQFKTIQGFSHDTPIFEIIQYCINEKKIIN